MWISYTWDEFLVLFQFSCSVVPVVILSETHGCGQLFPEDSCSCQYSHDSPTALSVPSVLPSSWLPLATKTARLPRPPALPALRSPCPSAGEQLPLPGSSPVVPLAGCTSPQMCGRASLPTRGQQGCWVSQRLHLLFLKLSSKVGLLFPSRKSPGLSSWKFSTWLTLSVPGKQSGPFLKHFVLPGEQRESIWVGAGFLTTETGCKFLVDVKCHKHFFRNWGFFPSRSICAVVRFCAL